MKDTPDLLRGKTRRFFSKGMRTMKPVKKTINLKISFGFNPITIELLPAISISRPFIMLSWLAFYIEVGVE